MGHDIGPGLEQVIGPHVANFMQLA
jgi:hypothetical protein